LIHDNASLPLVGENRLYLALLQDVPLYEAGSVGCKPL
jgi:hypothetical protein